MTQTLAHILAPSISERLARAHSDLRLGLPVLVSHANNHALVLAVEPLTSQRLQGLTDHFGAPELVLTPNRARVVAPHADHPNGPVCIDPPALATLDWFKRLADTGLEHTGPTGPLHILRSNETQLQDFALTLVKSAELLPAAVMFALRDQGDVARLDMPRLNTDEARAHLAIAPVLAPVAASHLPIEAHDHGRLHIFRDPNGVTEHYAMEIGAPDPTQPVLCRLHSACFTGDVLGSLKCDCGPQLRAAMARMGENGAGLLLYLNQEGRGIGLANKMRVYDLQLRGFDTVEANHRLGFDDDERDFRVAAVMLRTLGYGAVRLLTNNPSKVDTLRAQGVDVAERLPLQVGKNPHNQHYLSIKALKSGHAL